MTRPSPLTPYLDATDFSHLMVSAERRQREFNLAAATFLAATEIDFRAETARRQMTRLVWLKLLERSSSKWGS